MSDYRFTFHWMAASFHHFSLFFTSELLCWIPKQVVCLFTTWLSCLILFSCLFMRVADVRLILQRIASVFPKTYRTQLLLNFTDHFQNFVPSWISLLVSCFKQDLYDCATDGIKGFSYLKNLPYTTHLSVLTSTFCRIPNLTFVIHKSCTWHLQLILTCFLPNRSCLSNSLKTCLKLLDWKSQPLRKDTQANMEMHFLWAWLKLRTKPSCIYPP